MATLPPELIDTIVDETQNDETAKPWEQWRSLLACSLANRSFVPRARKYLFRSLILTTDKRCREFYDICQSCPVDIPSLVESLCIGNERLDSVDSDDTFPLVISSFVNMKSIHLRCLEWDDVKDTARQALASHAFHSISFDVCQFANSALLCSFISGSAATLRQLSFARCEMLTHRHQPFVGAKPAIERLIVYGRGEEAFDLEFLMSGTFSPIMLSSLQVLDICIDTREDILCVQAFLDKTTVPLNELNISHLRRSPFTNLLGSDWIDLPLRLGSVRSVTITMEDCPDRHQANFLVFLWWISNFKLCRPGCGLERVNFSVGLLAVHPWKDLDDSLAAVKSLRFFEVEVVLLDDQHVDELVAVKVEIQHQLPRLIMRNVARVRLCEPSSPMVLGGVHGVLGPFLSSEQ